MDSFITYTLTCLVSVTLLAMLMPINASVAGNSRIHLTVNGENDTRFRGTCRLRSGNAEEEQRLESDLPLDKFWQGESVVCEIEQISNNGRIEVILEKDGNRTRSRTSGAGSRIRLSIG